MVIKLSKAVSEAKKIAKTLKGGEVLALQGDLGSGKTTFTKALGKELGVKQNITSPTFVIMQHYKTKLTTGPGQPVWLYHLDLYRTKSFFEVRDLGLTEIWEDDQTITVIEWAEKISKHLPKGAIKLKFKRDES